MKLLTRRQSPALAVAAALAALAGAGAQAPDANAAAPRCTFQNGAVEVTPVTHGGFAGLEVREGEIVVLDENGDKIACAGGTPTVTTTDVVTVIDKTDNPDTALPFDGRTHLNIYRPETFSPGRTAEAEGRSEIEFILNMGADRFDRLSVQAPPAGADWVFGDRGFNWNGDADRDLLLAGPFADIRMDGHNGPDRISARGGGETGGPASTPTEFRPGAGNDVLRGGDGNDILAGDVGADVLEGFGGTTR